MQKISFVIDGNSYEVAVKDLDAFKYGKNERLSTHVTDVIFGNEFYNEGYRAYKFLDDGEFKKLQRGLKEGIRSIIERELNISTDNFELEKYHHVVKTDAEHFKIVSKTRDLFPEDFNFPIVEMIPKFERILGIKLTDINPFDQSKLHIIVRINRPFSVDFNPPHKDIYEEVDDRSFVPRFLNMWIPICGVTKNSSLPVAPASHLITEDKIHRTFEGAEVEGKKYRVRMIREWDGSNALIRPEVNYGQVLFFSAHLVHGLAINEENDCTRVALEFRLFKRD